MKQRTKIFALVLVLLLALVMLPAAALADDEAPVEVTAVGETPADETPAEETPAEETPAEETPAEETPAEETPAEETPAEETPAEETPAEETPTDAPAFVDVTADAWYAPYVDFVVENGLMQGTATDKFEPETATTRAMIVTILYRLEGEPTVEGEPPFSDVPARQWYTYAVMWAKNSGVVEGHPDGTFRPDDIITREQFVTILYRYAQMKGYDVSVGEDTNILSYEDAFEVSDWANAAIRWAVGAELLKGDTKGCLNPAAGATRAEAAALFQRFIENMKPTDETPTDETPTDETPTDETPTDETPTDETPTDETPTDETPTDETPADETPAENA